MNKQQATPKTSRKVHRPGHGWLMNESEIARQLGESPITIRNWRYDNIIPHIAIRPKCIRYRLDHVMDALGRRTIKPKK
jgi:hypothetical protein